MPREVVVEEVRVTVRVSAAMPPRSISLVRRRAGSPAFRRALARAVLAALGARPGRGVRVSVTR